MKILKGAHFWWIYRPSICNFVKNKLHYTYFSINFSAFWEYWLIKENFKENSKNFEIYDILCCSSHFSLRFQLLQLVRLTDQWSSFYVRSMNYWNWQHLLSSEIKKKETETRKVQRGNAQWKVKYIVYEKNMEITIWVFCWCQNELVYMIALTNSLWVICICTFKI